jgi:hypothetical protein
MPNPNDASSDRRVRPIRPVIAGITAGAAWSGLHVPTAIDAATVAELVAAGVSIAIVAGGLLALMAELAEFGIRFGRSRIHFGR